MIRIRRAFVVLSMVTVLPAVGLLLAETVTAPATPQDIFARRIQPIFKSTNPSSCTECHLAGVELKNYILPSAEKTFLSLRDQGLIDLDAPEKSRILALIQMGNDPKGGKDLISQ